MRTRFGRKTFRHYDIYLSLYPVMIWLRSSTYLSSVVTNSFNTFSLLQTQNKSKYEEEEKVGMLRLELEEVWCEEFSKDPEEGVQLHMDI